MLFFNLHKEMNIFFQFFFIPVNLLIYRVMNQIGPAFTAPVNSWMKFNRSFRLKTKPLGFSRLNLTWIHSPTVKISGKKFTESGTGIRGFSLALAQN